MPVRLAPCRSDSARIVEAAVDRMLGSRRSALSPSPAGGRLESSKMEFSRNLRRTIQGYYEQNEVPVGMDPDGAKWLRALIEETGSKKPLWRRSPNWISDKVVEEEIWERVSPHLGVQLRKRLGKKAWIDVHGKPLDEAEAAAKFALIFLHVYATDDVLDLLEQHKLSKPEFVIPTRWFSAKVSDPDYLG